MWGTITFTDSKKQCSDWNFDYQIICNWSKASLIEIWREKMVWKVMDPHHSYPHLCIPVGCALFSKFFGHNLVLIDHSELSTKMPSFSKLDNVYLCLWAIFDKYISHVIVTRIIYFVRYCNKNNSTENWPGAKVNVVQFQKLYILVLRSIISISTGICLKNFEKRAHPSIPAPECFISILFYIGSVKLYMTSNKKFTWDSEIESRLIFVLKRTFCKLRKEWN